MRQGWEVTKVLPPEVEENASGPINLGRRTAESLP